MTPDQRQTQYSMLRHDYYVAGRQLMFTGLFHPARLMLGYAVETHLKARMLQAGGFKKKLLFSHDLRMLWSECLAAGLFPTIGVSADFLDYADNGLNQRYPSQQEETSAEVAGLGRAQITSLHVVSAYDDLILQLDDAVAQASQDPLVSIGIRASASADTTISHTFFFCNGPAIERLTHYTQTVETHRPNNNGAIRALRRGPDELYSAASFPMKLGPRNTLWKADTFAYPKWEATPNGGFKVEIQATKDQSPG